MEECEPPDVQKICAQAANSKDMKMGQDKTKTKIMRDLVFKEQRCSSFKPCKTKCLVDW
jgi:hypothetical protein